MRLDFEIDVEVTCVQCGTERDFPERASRVLEGDDLFAEVEDACDCGANRVRVRVKLDAEEAKPEGRQGVGQRR